ncbi:MAG: hypothetical protein PHH13_05160 [Candidatus Peribacteraceae bacterium]|nr:hypothetical protein [Candidatus Peribacteraceae bacterium]
METSPLGLDQIRAIPRPTGRLSQEQLDQIIDHEISALRHIRDLRALIEFLQRPDEDGGTPYTDALKTDEELWQEQRAKVEAEASSPDRIEHVAAICVDLLQQGRDIIRRLVERVLAQHDSVASGSNSPNQL